MRKVVLAALTGALSMALAISVTSAQSTTGKIAGAVQDPSRTTIPGVRITITDTSTRKVLQSITNESGEFRFTVPAGRHEIKAELPGFTPLVLLDIRVREGETVEIEPLQLRVAGSFDGKLLPPEAVPHNSGPLAPPEEAPVRTVPLGKE